MTVGSYYHSTDNNFKGKAWDGTDDALHKSADNRYYAFIQTGDRLQSDHRTTGVVGPTYPSYPGLFTSPVSNNLTLKALAGCADRIKGHELDIGNSIAEGRETLKSVKNTLARLYTAAKSLKHGDATGALTALGQSVGGGSGERLRTTDPGNTWLAMQYGWLPLMSDVYELATNWEALTSPPRKSQFRSRSRQTYEGEQSVGQYRIFWKNVDSVEARVIVSERPDVKRSIGLADPLGVAWEVTPYSFVADWFIPISTYLDTLSLFQGLNATVSYTSYHQRYSRIVDVLPFYRDNGWDGWLETPKAVSREVSINRGYRTNIIVPLPTPKTFSQAMSPTHILNAAALLSGVLGTFSEKRQRKASEVQRDEKTLARIRKLAKSRRSG